MPARRPPQPLAHRNADFIRRFTAKQQKAEERIAKRPAALTAEQRAALRKQLGHTEFLPPDYADKTKIILPNNALSW